MHTESAVITEASPPPINNQSQAKSAMNSGAHSGSSANQNLIAEALIDVLGAKRSAPSESEIERIMNEIMEFAFKNSGDITFSDLMWSVDGFRDENMLAHAKVTRQTFRVGDPNSNLIIWMGHSETAAIAINRLLTQGRLLYDICSSKRYRNSKLEYPIIRRRSDAVRTDYESLHWVPVRLYLPESEKDNLKSTIPAEIQSFGTVTVEFYRDPDWPVRVCKYGLCCTYDSAVNNVSIYDDAKDEEIELTDIEVGMILTTKREVASWEEQFE